MSSIYVSKKKLISQIGNDCQGIYTKAIGGSNLCVVKVCDKMTFDQ